VEKLEVDKWLEHEKGWMFLSGWGKDGTLEMAKDAELQVLVEEVVEEVRDATFLWVLARKRCRRIVGDSVVQ